MRVLKAASVMRVTSVRVFGPILKSLKNQCILLLVRPRSYDGQWQNQVWSNAAQQTTLNLKVGPYIVNSSKQRSEMTMNSLSHKPGPAECAERLNKRESAVLD